MDRTRGSNPFLGLSKSLLQQELLNRLALLANLRTESKRYRDRLQRVRSELAEVEHELQQIQLSLTQTKVTAFPKPKLDEQPEVKRVIGRWGAVSYEPIYPPVKQNPRKRTASGD